MIRDDTAHLRAAASTHADGGGFPLSVHLCAAALFTLSWDRYGTIPIGSYTLRTSVVLLALALGLEMFASAIAGGKASEAHRPTRTFNRLALALLFVYLIAALLSRDIHSAMGQWARVALGAILPYLAVERILRRSPRAVGYALRSLVFGAVVASLVGIYQVIAIPRGWPSPVTYEGSIHGILRLASLSYEPAYFAQFAMIALGALGALSVMQKRFHAWLTVIIGVGLVLTLSRAAILMVPFFIALAFITRTQAPVRFERRLAVLLAALLVGTFVGSSLSGHDTWSLARERVVSIGNTHEKESNALRLIQYRAEVAAIKEHPVTGIGPGMLIQEAPAFGWIPSPTWTPNQVVANNIWLQALLDGGVFLLLIQLWLIYTMLSVCVRSKTSTRYLSASWLSVVVVSGMLTSNFYDTKVWATAGLILILHRSSANSHSSEYARPKRRQAPSASTIPARHGRQAI